MLPYFFITDRLQNKEALILVINNLCHLSMLAITPCHVQTNRRLILCCMEICWPMGKWGGGQEFGYLNLVNGGLCTLLFSKIQYSELEIEC